MKYKVVCQDNITEIRSWFKFRAYVKAIEWAEANRLDILQIKITPIKYRRKTKNKEQEVET